MEIFWFFKYLFDYSLLLFASQTSSKTDVVVPTVSPGLKL